MITLIGSVARLHKRLLNVAQLSTLVSLNITMISTWWAFISVCIFFFNLTYSFPITQHENTLLLGSLVVSSADLMNTLFCPWVFFFFWVYTCHERSVSERRQSLSSLLNLHLIGWGRQLEHAIAWVETKYCLLKYISTFLVAHYLLWRLLLRTRQATQTGKDELYSEMNCTGTAGFICNQATATSVYEHVTLEQC